MLLPAKILLAALLITASAAASAAEREKSRMSTLGYGSKPRTGVERANPCAAYGPGFQAVSSSSCLKISGSVIMETTVRRRVR